VTIATAASLLARRRRTVAVYAGGANSRCILLIEEHRVSALEEPQFAIRDEQGDTLAEIVGTRLKSTGGALLAEAAPIAESPLVATQGDP
jgi:hypothetical protein